MKAYATYALLTLALLLAIPACAQDDMRKMRLRMVERDIKGRGISNATVLEAMARVERHKFVSPAEAPMAYADHPLPIGEGQTISQPYVVALMTELAKPRKNHKVLEIGTGSGYQAAVLATIVGEVYSIEIIPTLANSASRRLKTLGYTNVHIKTGDGFFGWPTHAPFDSIIVTASTPEVPRPLLSQLRIGGRMVLPLGPRYDLQYLTVVIRTLDGYKVQPVTGVQFVPMTGEVEKNVK